MYFLVKTQKIYFFTPQVHTSKCSFFEHFLFFVNSTKKINLLASEQKNMLNFCEKREKKSKKTPKLK